MENRMIKERIRFFEKNVENSKGKTSVSNQEDERTCIKTPTEESKPDIKPDTEVIQTTTVKENEELVDIAKQEDERSNDNITPTNSPENSKGKTSGSNQEDERTCIKTRTEEKREKPDIKPDTEVIQTTIVKENEEKEDTAKQEDERSNDNITPTNSPAISNEPKDDGILQDSGNDVRETSYRFVCAIDLGTSHSGYAYSSKEQFEREPGNVVTKVWSGGNLLSKKAPTCVLYSPNGLFHSFGYDAEREYKHQLLEEGVNDWRMFKHFKMKLYDQLNTEVFMIEDQNGKKKLAIEVFSDALRYLRNDLLDELKKKAVNVSDNDCRWVFTVPAIWNNDARQFMIKAAEQAGIQSDKLMLCLEPEAAAILCKEDRSNNYYKLIGDQKMGHDIGSKLVVVDLGGGTVDITCNEVMSNGSMKEIKSATGGDCGGTSVDRQFQKFFIEMLDNKTFEQLQHDNQYEWTELKEEFEKKKREFDSLKNEFVWLKLPYELKRELSEEKMKNLHTNGVTLSRGNMKISKDIFNTFFKPSAEQVTACLKPLIDEDSEIRSIILVGGFSGCSEVRRSIQESFPGKFIIDAVEPDLPVMKGAVIFGHNPSVICSRISKYWYGIKLTEELKPSEECDGDFFPIISKGQSVKVGERISYRFRIDDKVTKEVIEVSLFYSANDKKPTNCEDSNCKESGDALEVCLPKLQNKTKKILTISVQFYGTAFEYSTQVTTKMPSIKMHKEAF